MSSSNECANVLLLERNMEINNIELIIELTTRTTRALIYESIIQYNLSKRTSGSQMKKIKRQNIQSQTIFIQSQQKQTIT